MSLTIVSYSRIRRNMTKPIGLHTVHVQRRWFKYILIESVNYSTDTNCFNTVFFVIHHFWPSTSNTSSVSADSAFDRETNTVVTPVRHRDLHCSALSRVNNAASCHPIGYDKNVHHAHTSNLRALNKRKTTHEERANKKSREKSKE